LREGKPERKGGKEERRKRGKERKGGKEEKKLL